jgi:hypothetical protein
MSQVLATREEIDNYPLIFEFRMRFPPLQRLRTSPLYPYQVANRPCFCSVDRGWGAGAGVNGVLAHALNPLTPLKWFWVYFLAAGGCPSGQRGQTVNLVATPSQVRILLPPPGRPRSSEVERVFGKDEVTGSIPVEGSILWIR